MTATWRTCGTTSARPWQSEGPRLLVTVCQVAIGVGDLGLAYQAFKIAISVEPNHAESYNNIAVLELRKGNVEQAQAQFGTAMRLAPHLFEPAFNGGLLAGQMHS